MVHVDARKHLTQPPFEELASPRTLAGLRLLVVGINYSPEPSGIAPYTTGMAEHLAEQGVIVKVLTGLPHYPQWRVQEPYGRRFCVRERVRGVEVVRLRHSVPHKMTAMRRASYEVTFLVHAALRGFVERPDVVLASTPSLGGALAAASVARRVDCPLVLVVQDLMAKATEQSGIAAGVYITRATARLEQVALRAATTVAVVSDSFRAEVQAYGVPPSRISSLRNWSHITRAAVTAPEARAQLGWPIDGFVAVHTGNMGFKQDLGNVIEAARLARASSVRFVLVGDGSQRRALERQAAGLDNVQFLGLVDSARYPLVLAAADVLLVNERPTVNEMSLPSKITSYLASGRPVVAAVARAGSTQRELERTEGAARFVAPGDPIALADELVSLVGAHLELRRMTDAATAFASEHLSAAAALTSLRDIICLAALNGASRPPDGTLVGGRASAVRSDGGEGATDRNSSGPW